MDDLMIPEEALQSLENLIRSAGMRESPITMPTKIRFVAQKGSERKRFEIHTSGFAIKENPGIQSSLTTWTQLIDFLKQSKTEGAMCHVSILNGIYTIACFTTDNFERMRGAPPVGEGIELVLNATATDLEGNRVMLSLFEDRKKNKEARTVYVGCLVDK